MKRAVLLALCCCAIAVNAFAAREVDDVSLNSKEYKELKQKMDLLEKRIEAQPAGEPKTIAEMLALGFEFAFTTVVQGTQNIADGTNESRNIANYRLDIGVMREFENGGMVFAKLRAGESNGLDEYVASLGGVNATAGNENIFAVDELWYEHSLFKDKFILTFGKLSPTAYFDQNAAANDETADFLAGSFLNNAAIGFVDNNLGIRASFMPCEKLDITYAAESAISGGLSFNGAMWKRENDKFALALGRVNLSKDYVNAEAVKDEPQKQAEVFYSLKAANGLFLTPSVQYLSTPLSAGGTDDNIFIYALRAQVNF